MWKEATFDKFMVLWRVWWYTPLIRRVLVRVIEFISTWVTRSLSVTHLHTSNTALSLIYRISNSPLHMN
jgi:hypothetical protein